MIPRIAILGWGSLIWKPGCLKIVDEWQLGVPKLPIGFSRISRDKRLTPVIDEKFGEVVPTRFVMSRCTTLEAARENLREREETPNLAQIGYWDLRANNCSSFAQQQHPKASRSIEDWGGVMQLDAVVWTALRPNFEGKRNQAFSTALALQHLENLDGEARAKAFEYITKATLEVMPPFQRALAQSP